MRSHLLSLPAALLTLCLAACDFTTSPTGNGETSGASGAPGTSTDNYVNDMGVGTPLSKSSDFGPFLFHSDLEDQDTECWGNRNTSGYTRSACAEWASIGSAGALLREGGVARSGRKAMEVTFGKNEDVGGASLNMSADVINVRSYYNFAQGFDFGQGVKIGRVSSFNETTQANDIDMVMTVRSPQSSQQCGLTDMADLGIFFNGKPVGHDWGSISAANRFERGRWYAIEYQVKLNAPGARDGSVKLWVDGVLAASKEGLNIRGSGGAGVKLNRVRIGGWYSNGANGNSCRNPSQASTMYVDDVAVGSDFIGLD